MSTFDDSVTLDTSLIAILLITKTRAGPRLLLHYPPTPPPKRAFGNTSDPNAYLTPAQPTDEANGDFETATWTSASDEDENRSDLQGIHQGQSTTIGALSETRRLNTQQKAQLRVQLGANVGHMNVNHEHDPNSSKGDSDIHSISASDHRSTSSSITTSPTLSRMKSNFIDIPSATTQNQNTSIIHQQRVARSWTHVLGFPADKLAKMLAPSGRGWHKKRFEVSLGERCFLGCPIFERREGGWGRSGVEKRKGRGKMQKSMVTGKGNEDEELGMVEEREEEEEGAKDAKENGYVDEGRGTTVSASASPSTAPVSTSSAVSPQDSAAEKLPNSQSPPNPPLTDPGTSYTSTVTTSSSVPSSNNDANGTPETLTMFDVVFVLAMPVSQGSERSDDSRNDPARRSDHGNSNSTGSLMDHQRRVKEVYTHCVKKLAKALQRRQKSEGYIWEQTKVIARMRDKAKEADESFEATYPLLLEASSLARLLANAFTGLFSSKIAHLDLGPTLALSLQLPQRTSTAYVPTPTNQRPSSPPTSGMWLTTFRASSPTLELESSETATITTTSISPHSALLLLAPADTLLKEIASSPDSSLAAPLTYYIRHTMPTKTLLQISRKSRHLSLQNIQALSLHLIHWRRARAIPPLHPTHTYICSPLADFSTLATATAAFGVRFSALPSLPAVLAKVGSVDGPEGTQSWGSLIPSADHKGAYMDILKWLVRSGWVTQLRTFAWVVVSGSVKVEVERVMRREEREAVDRVLGVGGAEVIEEGENEDSEGAEFVSLEGELRSSVIGAGFGPKRRQSSQGSSSLLSPKLIPHLFSGRRRPSESGSTSSVSTALRIPTRSGGRPEYSPLLGRAGVGGHNHRLSDGSTTSRMLLDGGDRSSEDVDVGEEEDEIRAEDFETTLILSPHKASALESRWLEHIGSSFVDAEVREAWPKLLKHFDGKHALEEIALREGMKRKVVAPILGKLMGEGGVLRSVWHW